MRALLVVNPKATTTSELSRDVLVRALGSGVRLTVEYTKRRGHAAELARRATREGYDVLVTLGGDGTVNEAVNGLLHDGPTQTALAVVPGGSTNVFARAMGLPRDPVEGTGAIIAAMQAGRLRSIGLGRAEGRYFTFCAGLGIDAEVVRAVERARLRGRSATPGLYLRSTVSQFLLETDRSNPAITLKEPGRAPISRIASVIVQNTAPWTYLGSRAVHPCPRASFDTGLDLMALNALGIGATTRTITQILASQGIPRGRHIITRHDIAEFTLTATRPMAFQLDGDYLGERREITLTAAANALRVYC